MKKEISKETLNKAFSNLLEKGIIAEGMKPVDPLLQKLIDKYYKLSTEDQAERPLLWWILGQTTANFKYSKEFADYKHAEGKDKCGTCSRAYQRVLTGNYICSWVGSGKGSDDQIKPNDWCKYWTNK